MQNVHRKYNSIYKIFFLPLFPRCSTSQTEQMGSLVSSFASSGTLGNCKVPLYMWDPWDMSVHYLNLDSDGSAKKKPLPPKNMQNTSCCKISLHQRIYPVSSHCVKRTAVVQTIAGFVKYVEHPYHGENTMQNEIIILGKLQSATDLRKVMPGFSGIAF